MDIVEAVEQEIEGEEQETEGIVLHPALREKILQGAQIAAELEKASNAMGTDRHVADGIQRGLLRMHRTLQQNSVNILLHALRRYGEEAGTDPRNEVAVRVAREVGEIIGEGDLPTI